MGLREPTRLLPDPTPILAEPAGIPYEEIPYAPERPPKLETTEAQTRSAKYPYVHGRGPWDATLACFQRLSQHWGMPFRRDVLRRALTNQFERTGSISLQLCGAIAKLMGLTSQLVNVPAVAVSRLQDPAMLGWQDSFAILYKANEKELVLAVPESAG